MQRFEYSRFATRELHDRLRAALAMEFGGKADVLGFLGEIVAQRVYVPEGFDDPKDYCVRALGMSPDMAIRRLRAARTARAFPALLPAVADGRLGVTAINVLGPHLAQENCDEMVALASGRTIEELERALRAGRDSGCQPMLAAAAQTGPPDVAKEEVTMVPQALAPADPCVVGQVVSATEPVFTPLVCRVAIPAHVREKLEHAKALLSHAGAARDDAAVLERALDTLIARLEQKKFGTTPSPRPRRSDGQGRYIPAEVRRQVVERDGGRCTFVGEGGHRCQSRRRLEFDHIRPVAKGGASDEANLRLRCRAHNQFTAEQEFGAAFVQARREQAGRRVAEQRAARERERARAAERLAAEGAQQEELVPWLRALGFGVAEARRAAATCAAIADQPLESRIKHALGQLAPACTRWRPPQRAGRT